MDDKGKTMPFAAIMLTGIIVLVGGIGIWSFPAWAILILGGIGGGVSAVMTLASFAYVPPNQYASVEWMFPFSPRTEDGHFIATGWQQGMRAKVYGPGWRFIFLVHLFGKITRHDIPEVPEGKFGLVFAKDGEPLPTGKVISELGVSCGNFTDAEAFLTGGGERGYQLSMLSPGKVVINEKVFALEFIDPVEIGTVQETFKDQATGQDKTRLRAEMGIVNSFVGKELGGVGEARRIVAKPPKFQPGKPGHLNFQDAVSFLAGGGQKGIQEELVFTGKWARNPKAFDVKKELAPFVPPGSVGVIISNVGDEPTEEDKEYIGTNKAGESVFILKATAKNKRGILSETKGPGDHFIHPVAYRLILGDVTPRSVLLDGLPEESDKFEKVRIVTSEGFTIPMEAETVYQIPPKDMPKIIAIGRSEEEFEEDIVVPFVDDISKRVCSGKTMLSLIQEREKLRQEIETALKETLETNYPLEVSTFRIKKFDFEGSPDAEARTFINLLARVANAAQEQLTITAEMGVQRKRIELELLRATADNQNIPAVAQLRADAAKLNKEAIDTVKETLSEYIIKLPSDMASKIMGVLSVQPGDPLGSLASWIISLAKKNDLKSLGKGE